MASLPEVQTFHLVSADNPGCGDSPYDDNHPLNIDGVVELMESFVAHWGLNRFLLVGGSMGGLVALLYAERNPNKVAGFVNVAGNLAPEHCMFSRSVVPHSYSHFGLRESECIVIELPRANHFLFYDQPNHYDAALACQSSCSFPNPGTPISRLAFSTFAKGEI
jgi:alpha-beta hydrolase superfamily lysophospholipase